MENTGLYDDALLYFLADNKLAVNLENAANIKRSVRDNRGKTDQLDARNIALYALKHHDELSLWERPRKQGRDYLTARTTEPGACRAAINR